MRRRLAAAAATLAFGPALAGCSLVRSAMPSPDTLDTWSDRPLPPSAELSQHALGANSPCIVVDEPAVQPLRLLVQDRRTESTAAVFMSSPGHFCSALISLNAGSGSGIGPALEPTGEAITIDDRGGGTVGDTFAEQLGGRVSVPAAEVVIRFADGSSIVASTANGYWLAWWPKVEVLAERVVALDAIGAEVAGVDVPAPGEPLKR